MHHLAPFQSRPTTQLPRANAEGWTLKRYAIVSDGRTYDAAIAEAATSEAIRRLPTPGHIDDEAGNHGIGFQIIHFAQLAVVAPVFYWRWGSVLANLDQIRAPWDDPTQFTDGVKGIVGCVWEMDIVNFEVNAWKTNVLGETAYEAKGLEGYFDQSFSAGH